tara:strand:- start:293 stop:499 length:207 start_codon:yes stop_codon:yes gene_type:complete
MRKIRHSVLPITLISDDNLDYQELKTISLQMTYKSMSGGSPWERWVDEYGEWFSPYKPNPNQLELFEE